MLVNMYAQGFNYPKDGRDEFISGDSSHPGKFDCRKRDGQKSRIRHISRLEWDSKLTRMLVGISVCVCRFAVHFHLDKIEFRKALTRPISYCQVE